jgi:hypothetical protein
MIIPYYMHQAGSIPGVPGSFAGGQTVYVDSDTHEVVSTSLIMQQPDNPPIDAAKEQPSEDEGPDAEGSSESEPVQEPEEAALNQLPPPPQIMGG